MKLRTLLVLLVLSISGAGLAASSTAVESIMKDYIYSKVDEDLDQALNGWAGRQELLTGSAVSTLRPPSAMYVMKIRDDGTYILNDSDSSPDLTQLHSSPQTVPAASNSPNKSPWRVMLGKQGSTTTIVGRSLEKENWILPASNWSSVCWCCWASQSSASMRSAGHYAPCAKSRPLPPQSHRVTWIVASPMTPRWPLMSQASRRHST